MYRPIDVSRIAVALFLVAGLARGASADCAVPTIAALKLPECQAVPAKLSVRVLGKLYELSATGKYWTADGLPSFKPKNEGITVFADGVPVYCSPGGDAEDLPGIGCAAVYTIDCSSGWLLEVASKPESAFKYVRSLAGVKGCEGENKTNIATQLLDVGRDEVLDILIKAVDGEPRVNVTREKIEKSRTGRRKGVLTLSGVKLLGEEAPLTDTPAGIAAAEEKLNGLKQVQFTKK